MNYLRKEIINMISDLYIHETFSYELYCYYSLIAKKMELKKTAKYMRALANDKITAHVTRTLDFLAIVKEAPNLLKKYQAPDNLILNENQLQTTNKKLAVETLFKSMLTNEMNLRDRVLAIADQALALKEYEAFEYIQWFVKDSLIDIGELKTIIFAFEDKDLFEIDDNISFREELA